MHTNRLTHQQLAFIRERFAENRRRFGDWTMQEAGTSGDAHPEGDTGDGAQSGENGPDSDPPGNPPGEMTPEQRADHFRELARKHENRNKELLKITGGKYGEELAAELRDLQQLRNAALTDSERAVAEAAQAAASQARAEIAPQLARMAFSTALSHVDEGAREALIDGLDLLKFVDVTTGVVDTAKVTAQAALMSPNPGKGSPGSDFGGGRGNAHVSTGVNAGRSRYQERFGKKPAAS